MVVKLYGVNSRVPGSWVKFGGKGKFGRGCFLFLFFYFILTDGKVDWE